METRYLLAGIVKIEKCMQSVVEDKDNINTFDRLRNCGNMIDAFVNSLKPQTFSEEDLVNTIELQLRGLLRYYSDKIWN